MTESDGEGKPTLNPVAHNLAEYTPAPGAPFGYKADGTPRKPGPWCGVPGPGRKVGAVNQELRERRDLSRAIVNDPEYRKNLQIRVSNGLAPHMETLLWHYAYGKPKDIVEVRDATNDFDGVTAEQLRERALQIMRRVKDPEPERQDQGEAVH